jgi:hypothetical protein
MVPAIDKLLNALAPLIPAPDVPVAVNETLYNVCPDALMTAALLGRKIDEVPALNVRLRAVSESGAARFSVILLLPKLIARKLVVVVDCIDPEVTV